MTLRDYIYAFHGAGLFSGNKEEIGADLFKVAGSAIPVTTDTVNKWLGIRGARKNYRGHFPDSQINESDFIAYIERRTRHGFDMLQDEFRKLDNHLVNCETNEAGIFYRSLLNQFLILLKLPLSDDAPLPVTQHINVELDAFEEDTTIEDSEPLVENTEIADVVIPTIESLPYVRNENFHGRSYYLDKIHASLTDESKNAPIMTTIYGLGGMGKSQLALQYAYVHLDSLSVVCWLDCSSEDTIYKSCNEFFIHAGVANEENPVIRLANWFHNRSNWLLILDDVDENTNIDRLLPKMGKGHIIITTRLSKGSVVRGTPIEIESMIPEDATKFLVKRTGLSDPEGAGKIAKRLGYLPLALEQAGAYIETLKTDFAQYLDLLRKYKLDALDSDEKMVNYQWNVNTVWNITLERLSEHTKHVLYCFAYMSPERIEPNWLVERARNLSEITPKDIKDFYDALEDEHDMDEYFSPMREDTKIANIVKAYREYPDITLKKWFPDNLLPVFTDELAFNRALIQLQKFSLITAKKNSIFVMHGLLQEIIQNDEASLDYIYPVFDVLSARLQYIDSMYEDSYQLQIDSSESELVSILMNIKTLLGLKGKYQACLNAFRKADKDFIFPDFRYYQFRFYSLYSQLLIIRKNYEKADQFFEKSIQYAISWYRQGKEGDCLTEQSSFTVIQEIYRRIKINLLLERIDKAKEIYESVKKTLTASMKANEECVHEALSNFAELWEEAGQSELAQDADALTLKCEGWLEQKNSDMESLAALVAKNFKGIKYASE